MSIPSPVLATSSASAQPTLVNDVPRAGGPTISPYARGNIAGTSIDATNNNLVHSCDFVNDLKKSIGLKKFLKAIAKWIREGIRAIMRLLGLSDASGSFSELINMLKSAAQFIRYVIKEYIEPINEFLKYVVAVLVKIRAIIQWILSLPAKLLKLLADCLTKLLKALGSIFADAWAETAEVTPSYTVGTQTFDDGSSIQTFEDGSQLITDTDGNTTAIDAPSDVASTDIGKDYQELAAAIKDAGSAASDLLKASAKTVGLAAGIATSATVGLLVPVSEAQVTEANKVIKNYAGSVPAGLETPADITQKKSNPV